MHHIRFMKFFLLCSVLSFFCGGCYERPQPRESRTVLEESEEEIPNVVQIFMHETWSWSVMVRDPETKVMTLKRVPSEYDCPIRFIPDVPEDQLMYVMVKWEKRVGDTYRYPRAVDFHVRADFAVAGAGWSHYGKPNRHGMTVPMQ